MDHGAAGRRRAVAGGGERSRACARAAARKTCSRASRASRPNAATAGSPSPRFDVGDGPAVFLILIVGTIIAVAAILVDLAYSPRWWVHLVWLPVRIALTLDGLRLGKAALLYQIYHHRAGEGRIAK